MEFLTIILTALVGGFGIYYFAFWNLDYFRKKGVPYVRPMPVFGNLGPIVFQRIDWAKLIQRVYNHHPEAKYIGFYDWNPAVLIRDPELVKSIAIKNFNSFPDHVALVDEVQDPIFGRSLASLRGERWREMRALLSPVFTSSKMKMMFKLMSQSTIDFTDFLKEQSDCRSTGRKTIVLEMKEAFTKCTNDVISNVAFGVTVNSMKERDNDFYLMGKELTDFDGLLSLRFLLLKTFPNLMKLLNLKLVTGRVARFFTDVIRTTIATRDAEGIFRPDMLQTMMRSRDHRDHRGLTIEDITAQAVIFFSAGFDSSSTLMSFATHEIAVNPEVHQKLQAEVDSVFEECSGEVTYEALNGMQYLEGVLNETLRMYPLVPVLERTCGKSFELPPALPGLKPFTIESGMTVFIPAYGIHHDPQYFPEPDKFDPERFNDENKARLIPFGLGPRGCIGKRFAIMEAKLVLFHLLVKFNLSLCSKSSTPIQLSTRSFMMSAKDGFWLQLELRE